MRFTVLGARGFVGAALVRALSARGHDVQAVTREGAPDAPLGHVVDCVGVTADFRQRPYDAVEAHVGRVAAFLSGATFDSFLYLSSTRVYARCTVTTEDAPVPVLPTDPDDLYAISKLVGESMCLTDARPTVRVARLSNVIGDGADPATFLPSVIEAARRDGHVVLGIDPRSERDFIGIDDVVDVLPRLATSAAGRLYNVASGRNQAVGDVVEAVCRSSGASWKCAPSAPLVTFPPIDIGRIRAEVPFSPAPFEDILGQLLRSEGSPR